MGVIERLIFAIIVFLAVLSIKSSRNSGDQVRPLPNQDTSAFKAKRNASPNVLFKDSISTEPTSIAKDSDTLDPK